MPRGDSATHQDARGYLSSRLVAVFLRMDAFVTVPAGRFVMTTP